MSYKIAIASSDGIDVDESFGAAQKFIIYQVNHQDYQKIEERKWEGGEISEENKGAEVNQCQSEGCASGACGASRGCGHGNQLSGKVRLIEDCRCIVCKKIGFPIQKQLERKAISAFDVSCSVEEALKKLALYFERVDGHQTLRGFSK